MTRTCRLLVGVVCLLSTARATQADEELQMARAVSVAQIALDKLPAAQRDRIADLLKHSVLYARGRSAAFPCRPGVYEWLLDHPQWGFRAWRALGAQCARVEQKEDGWFVGVDAQGSELRWQNVLDEPGRRLWYVEGTGRMAPWMPAVTLRALVLLHYQEVIGLDGRTGIRHRAELFAQFEEKSVGWLARLTGMTADGTAAKVLDQVELFFSGMAWYVSEHPAWAKDIIQPVDTTRAEERRAIDRFYRELAVPPKS